MESLSIYIIIWKIIKNRLKNRKKINKMSEKIKNFTVFKWCVILHIWQQYGIIARLYGS